MRIRKDYMVILFAIYVASYFYSAFHNYTVGNIEYITLLLLYSGAVLKVYPKTRGFSSISSKMIFFHEFKRVFVMVMGLAGISLFFQTIHLSSNLDLLRQIFFLICPAFTVFLLFNSKRVEIDVFIDIVLFFAVIFFVAKFGNLINMATISKINFSESYSPFEVSTSSITDIFFYCCAFYCYRKKKVRFLISAFFCFLSFKRMMVAGLLVLTVLLFFIEPLQKLLKITEKKKDFLYRNIYRGGIILFTLVPFLLQLLMTDSVANIVRSITGMDINDFVKGRFEILNYLIDNHPTNLGLGTVVKFMAFGPNMVMRKVSALHNDLYRLYYETTMIGLFSFVYTQFKNAKVSNTSIVLTFWLMINLIISNTLTNVISMMLFYMLICEFNYFPSRREENEPKNI